MYLYVHIYIYVFLCIYVSIYTYIHIGGDTTLDTRSSSESRSMILFHASGFRCLHTGFWVLGFGFRVSSSGERTCPHATHDTLHPSPHTHLPQPPHPKWGGFRGADLLKTSPNSSLEISRVWVWGSGFVVWGLGGRALVDSQPELPTVGLHRVALPSEPFFSLTLLLFFVITLEPGLG
jgi:hypothetical protein